MRFSLVLVVKRRGVAERHGARGRVGVRRGADRVRTRGAARVRVAVRRAAPVVARCARQVVARRRARLHARSAAGLARRRHAALTADEKQHQLCSVYIIPNQR